MRNKGYTLIELIVVIAILGSLLGISLISLSAISSGQAKKCASEIDALISRCKVGSLSREGDVYLKLYISGGIVHGAYYEKGVLVSDDKLSSRTLSVTYVTDETVDGKTYPLEDTLLFLSFDRDTGAFKALNDVPGNFHVYAAGAFCVRIEVTGGSRKITLTLVPPTASHEVS
jgi:prepilin-type N-terminal cleavage/methylation domain-containing protein